MERDCFAFIEKQHNRCKCTILKDIECKNNYFCSFYKNRKDVDIKKVEGEIRNYANRKTKEK